MTSPLRVAIAGLGRAGRAVAWECLNVDGIELVGAWNRGPVTDLALLEGLGPRLVTGGTAPPLALQDVDLLLLAVVAAAEDDLTEDLRSFTSDCIEPTLPSNVSNGPSLGWVTKNNTYSDAIDG